MTEHLYLLGHPIAHSLSPAMYNAVYERLGLPWRYDLADCATEEEAQSFVDARDFLSINITTPYKPLAYQAATAKAATAKLAQGANVLVKKGEALIGFNTDGQGCVTYLERTGFSFAGKRVAVCGTGPTALSILHACAIAGADVVMLVGRDKERSRKVLEGYVERFGLLANATVDLPAAQAHHRSFRTAYERTTFKFGSYTTSTKALAAADLVVNATPLGMNEGDGRRSTPRCCVRGKPCSTRCTATARRRSCARRAKRDVRCTTAPGCSWRRRWLPNTVRPRRGRRRPV